MDYTLYKSTLTDDEIQCPVLKNGINDEICGLFKPLTSVKQEIKK